MIPMTREYGTLCSPDPNGRRETFLDLAEARWYERSIAIRFAKPVHVLSTCRQHGGWRDDITAAVNYQICEPDGCPTCTVCVDDLDDHIDQYVSGLGLAPRQTCSMMTSASMANAGIATRTHRDVTVFTVATGGVETNAARAGDPSTHHESATGWEDNEPPVGGTLNLIVLVNQQLAPGAFVKAGIMATEAKSATLDALRVRSMYGVGIATGTGTDQFVIAAPQSSAFELTEAQAHTMLGQMIAETVSEALRTALALQCSLKPGNQSSVRAALMRFSDNVDVGTRNTDPQAVAAATALAAILDHIDWGILPKKEAPTLVAEYGSALTASLNGNGAQSVLERNRLSAFLNDTPDASSGEIVEHIVSISKES